MFAIELEIPSDDEKSLNDIVYHEDLDEVINPSRENVLNPNLRPEVDVEFCCCWSTTEEVFVISANVLELRATFNDNVVRA